MMIPKLTRSVPVLALLFPLSTPAAAQFSGDAAFGAPLNGFSNAVLMQVQQRKTKPAPKPRAKAPAAPFAPDAAWQKIVELVKTVGKYNVSDGVFGPVNTFDIEDVNGDPKADHTKDVVRFFGAINDDDKFEARQAGFSHDDYKLDAKTGNFNVDTWVYDVDLYGSVADVSHIVGVVGPNGKKISEDEKKLTGAEPQIKTEYDAMIKYWSERSVK